MCYCVISKSSLLVVLRMFGIWNSSSAVSLEIWSFSYCMMCLFFANSSRHCCCTVLTMKLNELINICLFCWKFLLFSHSSASRLYLSRMILPFFISSEALKERLLSTSLSLYRRSDFFSFLSEFSISVRLLKDILLTISFASLDVESKRCMKP